MDGVVIASTNTDAVGYYEFSEVPPGVVSVLVSRVGATLVDVPAEGHAAYGDERRNRAIASGEDAVIVHTVVSGAGILAGHPAETLNFGFRDHPLSTAIDIRLHATPEGVTIQLSTVNEAGCGDIVIYAWIDNAWAEVGRVPAWLVVGEGANTYAAYKYLGAGRIVTEDYENVEVKLDYTPNDFAAFDRFGRVLDQIWTDYGADPDVVLDHYSYTYDRAGNRTGRANELHSAFDEDYTYDRLDRLTAADRADNFDQSWTLDGLGNFRAFDDDGWLQTRTANAVNEIIAITGGWITPGYDDAGNMISGPKPGSGTTRVHYVYDAWNRLVKVRADDSGEPGDLIAEYQYDGTNRRIDKTFADNTGVEYFYNQEWQLLEERAVDDEGTPTGINQYVWSARYIDSPIMRFHDGNGDGDCLDAGDNIRYYTGDANFNVTATIDGGTVAVVERYVYTAYGEATVYDGSWSNPAASTSDGPLYCGYFFDAETGLYHVRNRYYDGSLSTFISRDPVGYFLSDTADDGYGNVWLNTPGSVNADFVAGSVNDFNLYRYVGNSPLTKNDPSGLHTHDDCDRWYDQCGDVCRRMPNKTWWDRNRRRMCWAACFAEYATCISTCEETVKCAVVGGACVAAGALVLCDGPLPIGDACAAGIVGAVICTEGHSKRK